MQWFRFRTITLGYSAKSTISFCPSCSEGWQWTTLGVMN
jgi:hypothetical protein